MQHNTSNYDLKQKKLQHIFLHIGECKKKEICMK
jgi:hypothetical protein